jgi:hypothetical protein
MNASPLCPLGWFDVKVNIKFNLKTSDLALSAFVHPPVTG